MEIREIREIRGLHNHPTYMIETSWGAVLLLVMVFVNGINSWFDLLKSAFTGGSKELIYAAGILGGIFVFFLLSLFFSFRIWRKTTLTIAEGSLTWEQNTLFAKKNEYAISTISNVNLEQNLFERIVGTYKLKIDTSSISTANQTDMKIILGKKDALEVRELILLLMKQPGQMENYNQYQSKESTYQAEPQEYDLQISPSENVKCAIAGVKESQLFWFIILVIAVFAVVIMEIRRGESISRLLASVIVIIPLVYGLGKSLLSSFLRTYNYKVRREDEHIYVSSGAIKIRTYSVPVSQIQAVRFQSTLLGRVMGRMSVSVINVSGEGDDVDGQWIFPAIDKHMLPQLMKQVLPEIEIADEEKMHYRPVKSMIRSLIRTFLVMGILFVAGVAAYQMIPNDFYGKIDGLNKSVCWIVLLIGFLLLFVYWLAVDIIRQSVEKILISDDRVAFRRGSFSWQQIEVSYKKIQMLETMENPVDRLFHLKKGKISLLASSVASKQRVPRFDADEMMLMQDCFRKTIQ